MIVTLDSKRRLTVPAALAPTSPGAARRSDSSDRALTARNHHQNKQLDIG